MKVSKLIMAMLMSILLMTSFACSNKTENTPVVEGEGEESGPRLTISETHDTIRKGVRMILSYDKSSSSFVGTVENTTTHPITSVRVEVHLSGGIELGPTPRIILSPGAKEKITLSAEGRSFTWWKAHAESGEGEGEGEHEGEGKGEHEHGEVGEHEHDEKGEHK